MRTAVEWFHSEYKRILGSVLVTPQQIIEMSDALENAKEIERGQMLKTFTQSRAISVECAVWNCQGNERKWESFEQYYNETFKQ